MEKVKNYLKSDLLLFVFSLIVSMICYVTSLEHNGNNFQINNDLKDNNFTLHKSHKEAPPSSGHSS